MKNGLIIGLLVVVIVHTVAIQVLFIGKEEQTHWKLKYCEIAEFSPDFTPQEKADCRLMRSKK
jgi:hypothetical protein